MKARKVSIEKVSSVTSSLVDVLFNLSLQLVPETEKENIKKETLSNALQKIIDYPNGDLFIAKADSSLVVGMLTMITCPHLTGFEKTWIEDVVVDANFRGQGIGEELVRTALIEAKKNGLHCVNLTSNPTRIAANHLYQKIGFQKYNTNYYQYMLK